MDATMITANQLRAARALLGVNKNPGGIANAFVPTITTDS